MEWNGTEHLRENLEISTGKTNTTAIGPFPLLMPLLSLILGCKQYGIQKGSGDSSIICNALSTKGREHHARKPFPDVVVPGATSLKSPKR